MIKMYDYLKSKLLELDLYNFVCDFENDCKKLNIGSDYSSLVSKYNLIPSDNFFNDTHVNTLPFYDGQIHLSIKHEASITPSYTGSSISFFMASLLPEDKMFSLKLTYNIMIKSFSLDIEIHESHIMINYKKNLKFSYGFLNGKLNITTPYQLPAILPDNNETNVLKNTNLILMITENFDNLNSSIEFFNLLYDIKIENSVVLQNILKLSKLLENNDKYIQSLQNN